MPVIIERGADWFAQVGTDNSKGTKVFSLVGKVNNTGLVEVPMGTTLRDIVYEIGGGIQKKRKFKAVQTGGPSGGCMPESLLGPARGLRQTPRGRCHDGLGRPYRHGRAHMHGGCSPVLPGLSDGGILREMHALPRGPFPDARHSGANLRRQRAAKGTSQLLAQLAEYVGASSLCALGGTAPNPVLSTLRHFRDEYETHVKDKRCPAGVCKALVQFRIDPEACTGCGLCARECPTEAITGEKKQPHKIDPAKCIKCGVCYDNLHLQCDSAQLIPQTAMNRIRQYLGSE